MHALLAITPIFLAVALMLVRFKAGTALIIAWLAGCFIAFFGWRMELPYILGFSVSGFIRSLDIILVVFGAILLLNLLKANGNIAVIGSSLGRVSQDRRVQILVVSWLFGGFLEGAAGFGTPAALAAPLLVGMGFPVFPAALASLVANSTAISFGVAGTPTNAALTAIARSMEQQLPGVEMAAYSSQLTFVTAILHASIGILVPFIVITIIIVLFDENRDFKRACQALPICVFAGLAFKLPYLLIARFIGPELPSLLGAIIGFAILIVAVKLRLFVPKTVWRFPNDPIDPVVNYDSVIEHNTHNGKTSGASLLKAIAPYTVVAILLVLSRIPWFPIQSALRSVIIPFRNIAGIGGINWNWAIMNNPGIFPFILTTAVFAAIYRMKASEVGGIFKTTLKQIKNSVLAFAGGVALMQIMTNTRFNTSGIADMVTVVGYALADLFGGAYLFVSPFVGVFGAMVSGSNTVSNIMFSSLQFDTAITTGLSTVLIVALQNVGGALGNLISASHIIPVCATTGAVGQEGKLIVYNLIPCFILTTLAVVVAVLLIGFGFNFVG